MKRAVSVWDFLLLIPNLSKIGDANFECNLYIWLISFKLISCYLFLKIEISFGEEIISNLSAFGILCPVYVYVCVEHKYIFKMRHKTIELLYAGRRHRMVRYRQRKPI